MQCGGRVEQVAGHNIQSDIGLVAQLPELVQVLPRHRTPGAVREVMW